MSTFWLFGDVFDMSRWYVVAGEILLFSSHGSFVYILGAGGIDGTRCSPCLA